MTQNFSFNGQLAARLTIFESFAVSDCNSFEAFWPKSSSNSYSQLTSYFLVVVIYLWRFIFTA